MKNLIMYFNELEDSRDPRGLRHELTNIIVMTIYAILCGYDDAESIAFFLKLKQTYFQTLLSLEYGTPSADTLLRVFALINPENFMNIFSQWISDIVKQKSENTTNNSIKVVPIDRKAIKSATDKINGGNIPYVVSAFLSDLGISIGKSKWIANQMKSLPSLNFCNSLFSIT